MCSNLAALIRVNERRAQRGESSIAAAWVPVVACVRLRARIAVEPSRIGRRALGAEDAVAQPRREIVSDDPGSGDGSPPSARSIGAGSRKRRYAGPCYLPGPASYTFKLEMTQAGASATVSVCVTLMNFARCGVNPIAVCAPVPLPVATGFVHFAPSSESST